MRLGNIRMRSSNGQSIPVGLSSEGFRLMSRASNDPSLIVETRQLEPKLPNPKLKHDNLLQEESSTFRNVLKALDEDDLYLKRREGSNNFMQMVELPSVRPELTGETHSKVRNDESRSTKMAMQASIN